MDVAEEVPVTSSVCFGAGEQYRRAAIIAGSAVAVVGFLCFFFATDAATHLSLGLKCLATFISIAVTLVCVRLYFRSGKK